MQRPEMGWSLSLEQLKKLLQVVMLCQMAVNGLVSQITSFS